MDTLDEIAGAIPVNLDDLIEERQLAPLPFPEGSIKNRAAMTALLSNSPEGMVEQYQAMLVEAQQGVDYTRESIKRQYDAQDKSMTQETVMLILGDPSLDQVAKMEAVNAINSSSYKDTTNIVAMRAAEFPSGNENVEQENVRISGAEQFREVFEYRKNLQSIKNRHASTLDSATGPAIAGFLETLLPFATNANSADTLKSILEDMNVSMSKGKAFALPGTAMVAIRETLAAIPPRERTLVAEKIKSTIENNNGIIFRDDNDFSEYQLINQIFEEGGYSTFDKWLDNSVGVLDIIGLGGVAKNALRAGKKFIRTPETVERNVILRNTADTTSHVSPARVIETTNPEQSRKMYELVVKSNGDEAANALYGTSKDDAISSQTLPQPKSADGSIEAKVPVPDKNLTKAIVPDEASVNAYYDNGAYYIPLADKASARAKIVNDLKNIEGFTPLDNMTTIGHEGNKVVINALYGTTEGGFSNAEDLITQAKFAFKEYGFTENNLSLYKKVDGEYVPVDPSEVRGIDGDYVVGVKGFHEITPLDISNPEKFTVKRNFFDRIPSFRSTKHGTLARTILDAASMLPKEITGGAVVAADQAARMDKLLISLHDDFSKRYLAIGGDRQQKLYEHIKEANFNQLELSDMDLAARGFTQNEIEAMHSWRRAWDTHFWFENADLARTMSVQGYKLFDGANARLFAKPVLKNKNIAKVYDPSVDKVVSLTPLEMDDLYTKGGTYAQLRRPAEFNGEVVEHIVIRNTPTEYLRAINPTDQVLNYRKGYYQVQYKAPFFVVQKIKDGSGNVMYTKAVEVAGSSDEARLIIKRQATAKGLSIEDFDFRQDIKEMSIDSDMYFDLQSAGGRVAQRHRGKLLEDSSAPHGMFDSQYIADPVESAIRAARSLSGRVASRDFLEMTKHRIMQQYDEFFPTVNGQKKWVSNSNDLVPTRSKYDSQLADARTAVEYMNYLQNGYINSLDEGFKGLMNGMSNMMDRLGTSRGEKTFLWLGEQNPMRLGKSGVFQAYIALNPLRQRLIQAHQAVRLLGYNPSYLLTPTVKGGLTRISADYLEYTKAIDNYATASKKQKDLFDFIEGSGQIAAIDRHNLVAGSVMDVAEMHKPIKRTADKILSFPRKIGFDAGEQTNVIAHLLTVRDKFVQRGLDVTKKDVRDEIYSVARAMSYDMNFAGDMPYNQNWASLFMQFFQVPHKAVTSVLTNRRIPWQDRMRLGITDILLWGVPGATAISNMLPEDMLPEDSTAREIVVFGLESAALNRVFSELMDEETRIDFSSLSPYGLEGWAGMFSAILSGGIVEMINNSPASNIYFREGSRMREAIGRLIRYTGFIDPYEGQDPETMMSVLSGVAEISSGWSNAVKAKAIYETGKILDKNGVPLNEDANFMNAAAKVFGFNSQEEALYYKATTALREGTKAHEEEVKKWYKGYVRVLARDQKLQSTDDEYVIKVLGTAKLVWKDDFTALQIIGKQLQMDAVSRKDKLIRDAIRYANIPENGGIADLNNLKMLKDEEYNNALKLHEDIRNAKGE